MGSLADTPPTHVVARARHAIVVGGHAYASYEDVHQDESTHVSTTSADAPVRESILLCDLPQNPLVTTSTAGANPFVRDPRTEPLEPGNRTRRLHRGCYLSRVGHTEGVHVALPRVRRGVVERQGHL